MEFLKLFDGNMFSSKDTVLKYCSTCGEEHYHTRFTHSGLVLWRCNFCNAESPYVLKGKEVA